MLRVAANSVRGIIIVAINSLSVRYQKLNNNSNCNCGNFSNKTIVATKAVIIMINNSKNKNNYIAMI